MAQCLPGMQRALCLIPSSIRQVWCCLPKTPTLRKWRQENQEFQVILRYGRPCLPVAIQESVGDPLPSVRTLCPLGNLRACSWLSSSPELTHRNSLAPRVVFMSPLDTYNKPRNASACLTPESQVGKIKTLRKDCLPGVWGTAFIFQFSMAATGLATSRKTNPEKNKPPLETLGASPPRQTRRLGRLRDRLLCRREVDNEGSMHSTADGTTLD